MFTYNWWCRWLERKHRDGMVWNCGKKTSSLNSTRLQFFLTVLLPLCSSVLGFRNASFFFFYYNEFQFFLTICKIFFICSHVYASFRDNDIDYIYTCSVSGCWPCTYELVKNYLFTNFDNLEVNIYIRITFFEQFFYLLSMDQGNFWYLLFFLLRVFFKKKKKKGN